MIKIRVNLNAYGNWNAFEGAKKVRELGAEDFLAIDWVSERLKAGDCMLSLKSDVSYSDVAKHRAKLAKPNR